MRSRTLALATGLTIAALAAFGPAGAQASKVKGLATSITYRAANGEQNDVKVGPSPVSGNYRLTESAVLINNVGTSLCAVVDTLNVDCPSNSVAKIRVGLRNGNDKLVTTGTVPVVVSGGAGIDVLVGGNGGDRINGGRDNDVGPEISPGVLGAGIIGGTGSDLLRGGAGNDVIESFDNGTVDRVSCGPGVDTVYADLGIDDIKPDCENRIQGPAPKLPDEPGGPDNPGGGNTNTNTTVIVPGNNNTVTQQQTGDPCPTGVKALSKSARVKGKRIKIKLRAPKDAKGTCKGKVRVDALVKRAHSSAKARLRIGAASFQVAPGKTKTVKVKLTKGGLKLVREHSKVKARVNTFTYRRTAGAATSSKITKRKLVIRGQRG